mgnify:CR=1 FL=1
MNTAIEKITPEFPKIFENTFYNLVNRITFLLLEEVNDNEDKYFSNQYRTQNKYPFYSLNVISISIENYIRRIIRFTHIEDSTLILAMIYIKRICQQNQKILLVERNVHKIFFASILLAIKINEDDTFTDSFYSVIAGIPLRELNRIESEFAKLINFKFFVYNENFEDFKESLFA